MNANQVNSRHGALAVPTFPKLRSRLFRSGGLALGLLAVAVFANVPSKAANSPGPSLAMVPTAGAWYGRTDIGLRFMLSNVPLDPDGRRMVATVSITDQQDPTLGGLFPTAVPIGTAHGEGIRTGTHSFEYTVIASGHDAQQRLLFFLESSGTQTIRDRDTFDMIGTLAVFLPSQDADGDGFVDEGEEPIARIPYSCSMHRVKVRAPFAP